MHYIESGVPPRTIDNLFPYTKQFRRRYKYRWSRMVPMLLKHMELQKIPMHWDTQVIRAQDDNKDDNEMKYRTCKSLCRDIYGYKEHKWISKHTFMTLSPLIHRLPSVILREIFICLYGHGP